jgi:hypothetical protein
MFMTKKRKRRRVNLGSPPSAHAKRARKLNAEILRHAKAAQESAKAAKCPRAQEQYEDALATRGEYWGHLRSIGRHEIAFRRAVSTEAPRAIIAARKALEQHCGRAK